LEDLPQPRADHADYITEWLQVLHNDRRAVFTAASKAAQAADYLAVIPPWANREADVWEAAAWRSLPSPQEILCVSKADTCSLLVKI